MLAYARLSFLAATWAQAACLDPLAKTGPLAESRQRVEVCEATNRYRQSTRLGALAMDPRLTQMAQAYAQDMLQRNFFGHSDPDGRDFSARLRQWRVDFRWAGENIGWGYRDSAAAMSGWIHSSGHRANILSRKFRKIGVGLAGTYWVQTFSD